MTQSQPVTAARLSPADANLWSTLAHVGNVLGPLPSLLILLVLAPRSDRVRQEARSALDVVLTALIAWITLWVLGAVVGGIANAAPTGIGVPFALFELLIGFAAFAIWALLVVCSLVAAARVAAGEPSRYPFSLHLIK